MTAREWKPGDKALVEVEVTWTDESTVQCSIAADDGYFLPINALRPVPAAGEAATEDVIERAARVVRETRIGPFGPNAREIISQGGTTYLTPAEADEIACALAAAGLLVDGRADAWDEGYAAGYCEGRHAFKSVECAPRENPYRQEQGNA